MPVVIPTIAFRRQCDKITDASVRVYVAAQQIQIDRDYAPVWGGGAKCLFVPQGFSMPPGAWECLLLDHSDDPEALGYHDVTADGTPLMKVFVGDDMRDGMAWSVTASHEVIECLGDPDISRTIPVTGADGISLEYARELCDCCEDEEFAYPINGVLMSDFAFPSWFDPDGVAPFTFRKSVDAPFALAEGGYIGVRERAPKVGEWTQRLAAGAIGKRAIKGPASRTVRRFAKG